MTIAEYLKRYDIDKHIAKIVEVYRKRRNVAIESIERYFPDTIKFTRTEGGLFTWIELPVGISAREVCFCSGRFFLSGWQQGKYA